MNPDTTTVRVSFFIVTLTRLGFIEGNAGDAAMHLLGYWRQKGK